MKTAAWCHLWRSSVESERERKKPQRRTSDVIRVVLGSRHISRREMNYKAEAWILRIVEYNWVALWKIVGSSSFFIFIWPISVIRVHVLTSAVSVLTILFKKVILYDVLMFWVSQYTVLCFPEESSASCFSGFKRTPSRELNFCCTQGGMLKNTQHRLQSTVCSIYSCVYTVYQPLLNTQ